VRRVPRPTGGVSATLGEARPNPGDAVEEFLTEVRGGKLSAEDVLRRFVTIEYRRTGSYEETARRLGLDRRTVTAKVDTEFLGRLR